MTPPDSPLTRSIGFAGVVRCLIAVAAVIAVGAAFAEGHYGLGLAGLVFLGVASVFAYRLWRSRQSL